MKLDDKPQRAWINAPSSHDPAHNLHGRRVLAIDDHGAAQVYFLSGDRISSRLPSNALSPGWPETSKP